MWSILPKGKWYLHRNPIALIAVEIPQLAMGKALARGIAAESRFPAPEKL
ncbi:hypothetical protein NG800_004485 [Epilithonimonas ginsengisoli]|uniref:Uncharacterized protein n=1 Tax=Epilithonimonas ginsengisoli TaxID=1245592 RepID=A0ABU4JEQ4_9FLAO|nr:MULTISPECIES: hypothetical protein [Chryseobacterium group]MBV6879519.1 hypothetical protein [Epilithonimonas sp. FP105]MDW8548155.1 hypothetical protein [Epilithonimonas ginsengisoli]